MSLYCILHIQRNCHHCTYGMSLYIGIESASLEDRTKIYCSLLHCENILSQ